MKPMRAAGTIAERKGLPCTITPSEVRACQVAHTFPPFRVVTPMVPVSGNVLKRRYRHPMDYARYRDMWGRLIHALMRPSDRKILEAAFENAAKIHLSIHVEHARLYDKDNLYAGVKPLVDSMRHLNFLYNDDPEHLDLEVTQEKSKENQTTLTIESAKGDT